MIDIDNATKQVDKADGFLTKLGALLKKHWKLIVLLLICYGIYLFVGAVNDYNAKIQIDSSTINIDASIGEDTVQPHIINTYIDLDKNNNERTIDEWSDGVKTVREEGVSNE
jgi:hypothetical protein